MTLFRICFFLIIATSLFSCEQSSYNSFKGQTMGTWYTITLKPESRSTENLPQYVEKRLQELNQNLSTYIEDSDLNQLNRADSTQCKPVSLDTANVMQEALRIYRLSNGAFDPGLGPLIELWGFDKKDTHDQIPSPEAIEKHKTELTFGQSKLDMSVPCIKKGSDSLYINFSAIAKGYGVDVIAELLENEFGIQHYLVEIGGEVRVKGVNSRGTPWRIAIEAPDSTTRSMQKIINPGIMGVATSGDYRNYFEKDGKRYSHTIDPTTGYPIEHSLASITVAHPSTMTADALATAIMVMGETKGRAFAEANSVPVFMIIKTEDGFREYTNEAFQPFIETPSE